MAEGLLRHLGGASFESLSAGARSAGYVHPLAVRVMEEIDVDISGGRSKSIVEFLPPDGTPPDLIISVCSTADQNCPVFPASVRRLHWPFDDPARAAGTEDDRIREFRRVRDEIRTAILEFIERASGNSTPQIQEKT